MAYGIWHMAYLDKAHMLTKALIQAYSFASRKMAHYFCPTCGSSCIARSKDPDFFPGMTCVNVRMLEGLELGKLSFKQADGKSYVAPEPVEGEK